ncbi:MAG: hypothetical protein HYR76_01525 [Ignavibacteria bacterium]|nr:hypothetical protein [Ignavibacteria bacterium]MBI3766359.1 hypothetical protein [Ignavibacteriales bacterium]
MNMLLTIFSFVLFGTLLVSDNNLVSNSIQISAENEMSIAALGSAQAVIDEAKTKAFDQSTAGGIEVADSTSMSSTLGTEAGELVSLPDTLASGSYRSVSVFNDVDDYNGYWRLVNVSSNAPDTLRVVVHYTTVANPDSIVMGVKMYVKKMTVTVKSPFISRPCTLSYVFSY